MASERMCVCGKRVSSMRRSDWCTSACKKQNDYEKRKEKLKNSKVTTFELVHSCCRPELGMGEIPDPKCSCREQIPVEEVKKRVQRGEIVLVGPEGFACYSSQHQKAPRAQTIEKAHIERANLIEDANKYDGKTLKELLAAVNDDKASRALEEKLRIEAYHEIEVEERRKLIREVPAEFLDRISDEQSGRQWLGLGGGD